MHIFYHWYKEDKRIFLRLSYHELQFRYPYLFHKVWLPLLAPSDVIWYKGPLKQHKNGLIPIKLANSQNNICKIIFVIWYLWTDVVTDCVFWYLLHPPISLWKVGPVWICTCLEFPHKVVPMLCQGWCTWSSPPYKNQNMITHKIIFAQVTIKRTKRHLTNKYEWNIILLYPL